MSQPMKSLTQTRAASTHDRIERLAFIFYAPHGTRVCELGPGQSIVVGRDAEAEVALEAHGVSRRHAKFSWPAEGPQVEDLGSTNGTRLNGRTVVRAAVTAGDALVLGDVSIGVVARRAAEPLPTVLDGYERFLSKLEDEVVRAHAFHRSFGVLRIGPRIEGAAVSAMVQAVRSAVRPVDSVGWYGSRQLLALLPEADEEATAAMAKALVSRDDVELVVSLACYPGDGADAQALISALGDAARMRKRGQTLAHATTKAPSKTSDVIVHSDAMRRVFAMAEKVAATPLPVLILGETGSGKEVLARHLHATSKRKSKPFVGINCAAIPATLLESTLFGHEKGAFTGAERRAKGVFEQGDGGTVFLDEIGELSPQAQAALLRVLETRRFTRVGGETDVVVDVRLLAATHRDLEAAVEAGTFRADLRFRIEGITLRLPSLRERPDDVLPLARRFLEIFGRTHSHVVKDFSPAAQAALGAYGWPGNVRELRNVVERCVVVADGAIVEVSDLPERVVERRSAAARGEVTVTLGDEERFQDVVSRQQEALERSLIVEALKKEGGNQTRAAKRLQLPLRTLVHKMKALGIRKQFGVSA